MYNLLDSPASFKDVSIKPVPEIVGVQVTPENAEIVVYISNFSLLSGKDVEFTVTVPKSYLQLFIECADNIMLKVISEWVSGWVTDKAERVVKGHTQRVLITVISS